MTISTMQLRNLWKVRVSFFPWHSLGWEKWSWFLLISLVLAYALPTIWAAPTGGLQFLIFWNENDPGGYYIPSAHQLFLEPGEVILPGSRNNLSIHPGLPLHFLLYFEQLALYLTLDPQRVFSFTEFSARHIWEIWIIARLSMVVLHIFSFYLLFHLSLAITKNRPGSFIAVLVYATSLPAFYYLLNVSVEPFLVIFFLLTFIMLWKALDWGIAEERSEWQLVLFSALAGFSATSGALTKLVILGPFPFFCLFILLISVFKKVEGSRVALGAFLAATLGTVFLYSPWTDWQGLLGNWGPSISAGGDFALSTIPAGLRKLGNPLNILFSHAVTPSCARGHIFFLAEPGFILLGSIGTFLLLINRENRRIFWPLAYAGLTFIVWLYRGIFTKDLHGFHYLIIVMAVFAVGLGNLASNFLLLQEKGSSRSWVMVWVMVFLMHQTAILTVMDAKRRDEFTYRNNSFWVYRQAMATLPKDGKVASIDWSGNLSSVHALATPTFQTKTPSLLIQTADDLFVRFDNVECGEALIEKMLAASVVNVLDFRSKKPVLLTLEAFQNGGCEEQSKINSQ